MKKKIKMIGLDLDGTVLSDHKTVAPRVVTAIQRALEAGIVVLPATGRQLSGIPKEFLDIPGIRYALSSNGAKVHDLVAHKVVHADCFDKQTALSLLEYGQMFETATGVYMEDKGYGEPLVTAVQQHLPLVLLEYIQKTRTAVPSLAQLIRQEQALVEKITILFVDMQARAQAIAHLQSRKDISLTWAIPIGIEINTRTANKGAGLLALGRYLGIEKEEIMAIGDGHNDIEMLRTVGYGVAMGNAEEEVKMVADAVTEHCNEDGVAIAIEKIL